MMTRLAPTARAYQLRYLAQRAVSDCDGDRAWRMIAGALAQSRGPLIKEPVKTVTTLVAALVLRLGGRVVMASLLTLKAQRP